MRTMLISLILFCSLIQFAETIPQAGKRLIEDCGTNKYICFVPEKCTKVPSITSISDGKITKMEPTTEVNDDCEAVMRFHHYSEYFVYIWIQSFQKTDVVKSIGFKQESATRPPGKEFYCKIDSNGKLSGGETISGEDNEIDLITKNTTHDKLECIFEIRTSSDHKIFETSSDDLLSFKINNLKTQSSELDLKKMQCDPSNFEYIEDPVPEPKRLYKEVIYAPGDYYCDHSDERYKLEYRKYGSEKYEAVSTLECDRQKFKIDGNGGIEKDDSIFIRCVAEAKFFCKYKVKAAGSEKSVEGPNMSKNEESKLECPPGTPHLIIIGEDGGETPILNPKFECLNLGNDDPKWKVNEYELTAEGPKVYCTNEVKCHQLFTIPDSAVTNGIVDAHDFLPKCYETGTLYVQDEGKEKIVENTKCDGSTGDFKYIMKDSQEYKKIGKDTKFICRYPDNPVYQQNKKAKEKILYGSIGAGVGAAVLVIVFIVACCFILARRERKNRKAATMQGNAAWLQYAGDVKVKNTNDIKKGKPAATNDKKNGKRAAKPGKAPAKPAKKNKKKELAESEEWNIMQMSRQFDGLSAWRLDAAGSNALSLLENDKFSIFAKNKANDVDGFSIVQLKNKGMAPAKEPEYDFSPVKFFCDETKDGNEGKVRPKLRDGYEGIENKKKEMAQKNEKKKNEMKKKTQ